MSAWTKITATDPKAQIEALNALLNGAEAVVVGTGAGLSAAGGFTYHGPRFTDHYQKFIEAYGFLDMLHAALYDFPTWETYWAFESEFILMNYWNTNPVVTYTDLASILRDKNYFILSTNADNRYRLNDFDMDRVFQMQGEYGKMQCTKQCHNTLYDDEALMWRMVDEQADLKIPSDLIPRCPKCGAPLEMNKRDAARGMVEDEQFVRQRQAYEDFMSQHEGKQVLFLEIGVGFTTPQFIKRPFQEAVARNPKAQYVTLNARNYQLPQNIRERSSWLSTDIKAVLHTLATMA